MTAGPSEKALSTRVNHSPKAEDDKRPATASHERSSLSWAVYLAAASAILACLMAIKHISSSTLPETYALCSRRPDGVYTVDQHNSQTQCIVVQGAYIVETGSLGEPYYLLPRCFLIKSIRICQNFSAISLYSLYCTRLNHCPRYKWYVVFFSCFQGYYLAKYPQTLMHIFWNMGQPSNFLLKVLKQLRVCTTQFYLTNAYETCSSF